MTFKTTTRRPGIICALCSRAIEHPTWNQRVHPACRRAWKRRQHAIWWAKKGADRQRRQRVRQRAAS
jgi:hypothetical protein